MRQSLNQLVDEAERIGVVGSPSSTSEMALDILAGAVNKKLVGELALFRYHQDGLSHYALGQITEVKLRNVWHEDPTMRSLIRQRGQLDPVSGRQDTHLGEMTISAVFSAGSNSYRPSILALSPPQAHLFIWSMMRFCPNSSHPTVTNCSTWDTSTVQSPCCRFGSSISIPAPKVLERLTTWAFLAKPVLVSLCSLR